MTIDIVPIIIVAVYIGLIFFALMMFGIAGHDDPAWFFRRIRDRFRRGKRKPPPTPAERAATAILGMTQFKRDRRARELADWIRSWIAALPPKERSRALAVLTEDRWDGRTGHWNRTPNVVRIRNADGDVIFEYAGPDTPVLVEQLRQQVPAR